MKREILGKGTLYNGDCLECLSEIESDSIDSVITSPPYYQLRDYGYPEQWGLEPDYRDYLDKMIRLMEELKRIIKPTGTIWINLGDTYSKDVTLNRNGEDNSTLNSKEGKTKRHTKNPIKVNKLMPNKSLMLIPQRFAIRCIDELGLICRNEIIWAKRNGSPESVTDRFTKKHEQIYFFVKNSKYYFDLDSIRDEITSKPRKRIFSPYQSKYAVPENLNGRNLLYNREMKRRLGLPEGHINGKNPGDVADFWEITTKPNRADHFATYNSELIIKPILAGCPEGGIVLDPFAGTGTTGVTAMRLNRNYIMIERSEEYYHYMKENVQAAENESSLLEIAKQINNESTISDSQNDLFNSAQA